MGMWKEIENFDAPFRNAQIFSVKRNAFVKAFSNAMYIQHATIEEVKALNPKLWRILELYGCAFDDYWYYWLYKKGRYVRRTPLWLDQKAIPTEKPRKYEPNYKLEDFPNVRA